MVDAPCEEDQVGAVEGPVVVDPAQDLRIDSIREAGQVRAAAQVEVPGPDLTAFRFLRAGADGRVEAGEISALAQGPCASGRYSQGNRSWCARNLPGGSRPCSTRSSSSPDAAPGPA